MNQRLAFLGRAPIGRTVGPTVEPADQGIDFRKDFEMC
jgi:hypothetical protein